MPVVSGVRKGRESVLLRLYIYIYTRRVAKRELRRHIIYIYSLCYTAAAVVYRYRYNIPSISVHIHVILLTHIRYNMLYVYYYISYIWTKKRHERSFFFSRSPLRCVIYIRGDRRVRFRYFFPLVLIIYILYMMYVLHPV